MPFAQISSPPTPPSNLARYITALVIMSLVGALAIVAITLARPHADNTLIYAQIVAMIVPSTTAILALLKVQETGDAVHRVHIDLNSRLSDLLEQTALASKAEGREEARIGQEEKETPA